MRRGDPVITRRDVLLASGIGLLFAHPLGRGQPAATIRRVGMLSLPSEAATAQLHAAFRQGMRDLGWSEGKNASIDSSAPMATWSAWTFWPTN
jgi:hypothetical protein